MKVKKLSNGKHNVVFSLDENINTSMFAHMNTYSFRQDYGASGGISVGNICIALNNPRVINTSGVIFYNLEKEKITIITKNRLDYTETDNILKHFERIYKQASKLMSNYTSYLDLSNFKKVYISDILDKLEIYDHDNINLLSSDKKLELVLTDYPKTIYSSINFNTTNFDNIGESLKELISEFKQCYDNYKKIPYRYNKILNGYLYLNHRDISILLTLTEDTEHVCHNDKLIEKFDSEIKRLKKNIKQIEMEIDNFKCNTSDKIFEIITKYFKNNLVKVVKHRDNDFEFAIANILKFNIHDYSYDDLELFHELLYANDKLDEFTTKISMLTLQEIL